MSAQNGKRGLSNRDLATLARDGQTPEEIAEAYGIAVAWVKHRMVQQGLIPMRAPGPTMRTLVVPWFDEGDAQRLDGAACYTGGHDPELWHEEKGGANPYAEARVICNACPVRLACLDAAMRAERGMSRQMRFSMYGGLTLSERSQLDQVKPTPGRVRKVRSVA